MTIGRRNDATDPEPTYRALIDPTAPAPRTSWLEPALARLRSDLDQPAPGAVRPDGVDRLRPAAFDWVISGLLALLAVAEAILSTLAWPAAALAAAGVAIVVLPWRRVRPIAVAVLVMGTNVASAAIYQTGTGVEEGLLAGAIAAFMAVYALCRWAPATRLPAALGGVGALVVLTAAIEPVGGALVAIGAALVPLGAVLGLALAMRYRARLGEEVVARARLAERNELARELHDVVAHHVSAIAVQAQAAQAVAAERPEVAASALAAIETSASTTLAEMRRMVGILRSDERRPTIDPEDLANLADPSGAPKVTVSGDVGLADYSSPVGAALLRIAQEATTNARRHSSDLTFIDIVVTRQAGTVEIEVINDGTPRERRNDGFGLIGMEERAAALGGTIATGPRATGGWSVAATLPLETA